MRLVKHAAILAGLAGAVLATASAALAHDDDHGWRHRHGHRHHHDHGPRFVEPPVRFLRAPPVVYERPVIYREVPAYSYYPPAPPSLNINIPLR
jgi:hypothetical protein